jgi:hypothetical protein
LGIEKKRKRMNSNLIVERDHVELRGVNTRDRVGVAFGVLGARRLRPPRIWGKRATPNIRLKRKEYNRGIRLASLFDAIQLKHVSTWSLNHPLVAVCDASWLDRCSGNAYVGIRPFVCALSSTNRTPILDIATAATSLKLFPNC